MPVYQAHAHERSLTRVCDLAMPCYDDGDAADAADAADDHCWMSMPAQSLKQ